MNAVALKLGIPQTLPLPAGDLLPAVAAAANPVNSWDAATDAQRRTADLRMQLIGPALTLVAQGASANHAAQWLAARLAAARTADQMQLASRLGGAPSVSTLKRWIAACRAHGKVGLLTHHTGRVRREYGWEARAIELYNKPGKPNPANVAFNLQREGYADVTESRVARYLKSLPASLGEHSPARVGRALHKLKFRRYQPRTSEGLLVGEVYAGDGHTADCYVAHPVTGGLLRPEITAWIDVRSLKCVGWWLSETESAVSTLFALASAWREHDHVNAWIYIDHGAGWRAQMLSDEATGIYARMGIEVTAAHPGNPHGKGWIERFFRSIRDYHDKFFADGMTYCGDDMAPEINRRLSVEAKSGRRKLPSLASYRDSLAEFIRTYNATPKKSLGNRSPDELWAQLDRVPVGLSADAMLRPAVTRKILRQMITLDKRMYYADAFVEHNGREVIVEYDLHDDQHVWVRDLDGRFIAQAEIVNKISTLPRSRLDEQREKSRAASVKRHQRRIDETNARTAGIITADGEIGAIESVTGSADDGMPSFIPARHGDADIIDIDILDYK